ncbi:MAG: oxaloacetate-decarboxylating malate dehydrogenase, partial [Ilumatobacteraceae bacterium]|nr:oxaloacetate-decarboxylating malate dehydrogenase [Ilumatobacteraceae bacterium]
MLVGRQLLANRYHNKGTAFTSEERDLYRLNGLLPPVVEDLDTQLQRVRDEFDAAHGDLARHIFLRALQANNSVLFYRFLVDNLEELLPIVYTPTVGLACQEWSRTYRREHGLYVSWPDRHRVPELLDNALSPDDGHGGVDVVVVTDGERILGLGDLGVGGMGIPIGKLALYTAVGGVDPERTLPVFLDAGTENEELLSDPLYLGWRNRRLRDDDYDELVLAFVEALRVRCPRVLLQWEDFAQRNANRLLNAHRDRICSFNDDIQGTAAVAVAAIVGGMRITRTPLTDLRVVIAGAGSAGIGIARQATSALVSAGLALDDARRRCWLVDRDGLLHDRLEGLQDFQADYVRPWESVAELADDTGRVSLLAVVRAVAPHALVGVTGQPGLFTEAVVRAQAEKVVRPIVLALSNPTRRAEAIPSQVLAWTDGRALVGTGSPFPAATVGTQSFPITQVNNLYLFPGLGRGVAAVGASRVSDSMLSSAATAIGSIAPR